MSHPVFAARTITIAGDKSTLENLDELNITASVSGFTDGETIFIKGAFFKEGSTNYFGYTKKDNDWIKNSETSTSQKAIVPNQWDGSMVSRVDFSDSGFAGEGDYLYKVGFYYTSSGGSLSSINWSENQLSLHLKPPAPTPTPTPTPTHAPTATPTPILTPTNTPTSVPQKTPTPTISRSAPTLAITDAPTPEVTVDQTGEVKGEMTTPTPTLLVEGSQSRKQISVIGSFIFIGVGLALLSGVLVWKKRSEHLVPVKKDTPL